MGNKVLLLYQVQWNISETKSKWFQGSVKPHQCNLQKSFNGRGWLHVEFQPELTFQPGGVGWNIVAITWQISTGNEVLFPRKQPRYACSGCLFSPGWHSISITWTFCRFFSLFARAENESPVWETWLVFSAWAEIQSSLKLYHVIATFISRGFLSEPGLKFQPDWNSPCNHPLRCWMKQRQ